MPRIHDLEPMLTVTAGAVAPLASLLAVPALGMVGFSVDLGYVATTGSEVQGSADSAALAGRRR